MDAFWHAAVRMQPGFRSLVGGLPTAGSRPIDLLLLFDQACIWVDTLRRVCCMLAERPEAGRMTKEQVNGLIAVTARLVEEIAAVRSLTMDGLAMPAIQISRSISEDVDLALVMLVRRKIAERFVDCDTPEEAAAFWRNHVAGGRAFRTVSQALYRYGLDFSEDSDYARWRKEVLVFLGSVVHTSALRPQASPGAEGPFNAAAQECLYFSTTRLQELCAYSQVLGGDLRADIETLDPGTGLPEMRKRLILNGADIIVDQMRWLTEA